MIVLDMLKKRPIQKRKPYRQFFRQWREHLDLTQDRALERLEGWSQSKLSRIESGATVWNAIDLADLEQAYGISEYLLLNVDPTKEGEVVDILGLINDKNREQAIRILRALNG